MRRFPCGEGAVVSVAPRGRMWKWCGRIVVSTCCMPRVPFDWWQVCALFSLPSFPTHLVPFPFLSHQPPPIHALFSPAPAHPPPPQLVECCSARSITCHSYHVSLPSQVGESALHDLLLKLQTSQWTLLQTREHIEGYMTRVPVPTADGSQRLDYCVKVRVRVCIHIRCALTRAKAQT